jgi:hypothetical protein
VDRPGKQARGLPRTGYTRDPNQWRMGESAWRRLHNLSEEQGFGALHWGKREIPNFWIL